MTPKDEANGSTPEASDKANAPGVTVVVGKPGRRMRKWLGLAIWLTAAGGLAGVVFVLSFYLAMRIEMRSSEVTVPDLAGQSVDEATGSVAALDLVLQVVEQRNDPSVDSGRILQQTPPAGVSVRRGRKIKLILSLGDKVLEVPNIVGEGSRAVAIELRQLGLTPGHEVRIPSDVIPDGRIIAQVPPATTPAVPNTRVHRLVSSGPQPTTWVMPDLEGRTRREVEDWARRSGFRVAVRSISMNGRRSGTILGQLPLSGYPIRTNDVVELTVAR